MKPQVNVPLVDAPALSPERQLLWEAANVIERDGWGQGIGLNCPKVGYCVITATAEAEGREPTPYFVPAIDLFARHIGGTSSNDVGRWNDAPGRTQAEVLAALRAAALEGQ